MANGIYEALITTVFGLIIAIIAMVSHSILSHIVDRFASRVESACTSLIAQMDEKPEEDKKINSEAVQKNAQIISNAPLSAVVKTNAEKNTAQTNTMKPPDKTQPEAQNTAHIGTMQKTDRENTIQNTAKTEPEVPRENNSVIHKTVPLDSEIFWEKIHHEKKNNSEGP